MKPPEHPWRMSSRFQGQGIPSIKRTPRGNPMGSPCRITPRDSLRLEVSLVGIHPKPPERYSAEIVMVIRESVAYGRGVVGLSLALGAIPWEDILRRY